MCLAKNGATFCPACLDVAEMDMLLFSSSQLSVPAIRLEGWWFGELSAKNESWARDMSSLDKENFLLFDALLMSLSTDQSSSSAASVSLDRKDMVLMLVAKVD